MTKITPVTDEERELLNTKRGRSGRVAWAILKQFEESGLSEGRLETNRPARSIIPTLRHYIKAHKLNYEVRQRRGKVFIMKVEPKEIKELTPEEIDLH